jgi:hypothetical protein
MRFLFALGLTKLVAIVCSLAQCALHAIAAVLSKMYVFSYFT